MKAAKPAELRKLSLPELDQKAEGLRQSLFKLRVQHGHRSLAKTADIAQARHELARVLTIAAERRRAEAKA